ncbi:FAD-binding protein [Adlercreutzia sp. R21]|uniref:FAD-dependent oxidoreductase n=1 Tax=Adlercreutzia wanghongyangiae TaxID=3111451 RepID=UPI002DBC2F62|nr:FAD-binding protein [Adlercreutzia sp. R21]MEC4184150.1 FAD-binding protein [Adlercreutzia sp. R21]
MEKNLSRRNFLAGGAAASMLGLAALTGCAPSTPKTAGGSEGGASKGEGSQMTATASDKPWEVAPAPIAEDEIAETIESDVVIIGLGASGTYAATSAIENGLSVTVLERNDTFNANGGSHFMFNSKCQLEQGEAVDTAVAVKDFLNIGNYKMDGSAVWAWANRSGEAADWFADVVEPYGLHPVLQHSDDVVIEKIYPGTILFIGGANEPTSAIDQDPYNGDLGLGFVPEVDLLGTLLEHIQGKGADVRFKHTSQQLVREENGRVTAVIATDESGAYKKFVGTKGIVVATGSYSQDADMLNYFCPMVTHNPNGDKVAQFNMGDGSGIKQSLWAGGAMQNNGDHPPMMFWGATNCIKNVMVNATGKRFIDENAGQSNMAAVQFNQPGSTMVALWNDAYAEQLPAISYRADDPSWAAKPEELLAKWNALVEEGIFMKADSLDEIAAAYELPADVLQQTVDTYNGYCAAGEDLEFHKDPATLHELTGPYFATKYDVPASLACMGGLHVNAQSQVLTAQSEPIEGLYAIGLAAGDFYANQYSTRFAGNSLGRCMTFGYLVGRQLAGLE